MALYKLTRLNNDRVRRALTRLFEIDRERHWTIDQINKSLRALDLPCLSR